MDFFFYFQIFILLMSNIKINIIKKNILQVYDKSMDFPKIKKVIIEKV